MAKFCGGCGTKWDDDVKVCGACGKKFDDVSPITSITGDDSTKNTNDDENTEKLAKVLKIGTIGVAAVVVIAIISSIFSNMFGYKANVKKIMNSLVKKDSIAMEKAMSKQIVASLYDPHDTFEDIIEDFYEEFEDELDGKFKIKYKITNSEKLEGRREKDFRETLDTNSEINASEYKKFMSVKVTATASYRKQTQEMKLQFILAKEKGKWVTVYFDEI